MKKFIEYTLKHNRWLLVIYRIIGSLFFKCLGLFFRIEDDIVLFRSNSNQYNDSPKAILEYLLSHSNKYSYRYYYASNQNINHPLVITIKPDSLKYFIIALKAKYWICSVNIERGLSFKKRKTIFLNTWHGVAINKMGNDVNNRVDFNWTNVDYVTISNDAEINIYKQAFNCLESSFLKCGLPRNDELYSISQTKILETKQLMKLPLNKKIILYAPTWRDSQNHGHDYTIKPPIDWNHWYNLLGNDYIILLRCHPNTTKLLGVEFNDFIYDGTKFSANQNLVVSDILISDYSSIFYDFAISERPMFCFGYDYEQYVKSRGFYYDLEQNFYCGIIKEEKALLNHILYLDYERAIKHTKSLKSKHIQYGGNACLVCINSLFGAKNEN